VCVAAEEVADAAAAEAGAEAAARAQETVAAEGATLRAAWKGAARGDAAAAWAEAEMDEASGRVIAAADGSDGPDGPVDEFGRRIRSGASAAGSGAAARAHARVTARREGDDAPLWAAGWSGVKAWEPSLCRDADGDGGHAVARAEARDAAPAIFAAADASFATPAGALAPLAAILRLEPPPGAPPPAAAAAGLLSAEPVACATDPPDVRPPPASAAAAAGLTWEAAVADAARVLSPHCLLWLSGWEPHAGEAAAAELDPTSAAAAPWLQAAVGHPAALDEDEVPAATGRETLVPGCLGAAVASRVVAATVVPSLLLAAASPCALNVTGVGPAAQAALTLASRGGTAGAAGDPELAASASGLQAALKEAALASLTLATTSAALTWAAGPPGSPPSAVAAAGSAALIMLGCPPAAAAWSRAVARTTLAVGAAVALVCKDDLSLIAGDVAGVLERVHVPALRLLAAAARTGGSEAAAKAATQLEADLAGMIPATLAAQPGVAAALAAGRAAAHVARAAAVVAEETMETDA